MNIQYGTIQEFKYETLGSGRKLIVKVLTDDRLTNWLPIKTKASLFLKEHTPVRKGDQVLVFNPFGNNEDGFVDCNLSYEDLPLPADIDEDTFYQLFNDGTVFTHNTKTKEIKLDTPCSITIIASKDVHLTAPKVTVVSPKVNVDSPSIDLGLGGKGNVTGDCICAYTGNPHHDFSSNTRSKK